MRYLAKQVGLGVVVVVVLVGLGAACAIDEPPAESLIESAVCSVFICGDNAATAGDGLLFDEFDLFGRPNYAGVALLGATLGADPTRSLKLGIDRDRLFGIDPYGIRWEGGGLKDTVIQMKYERPGYHEIFELKIVDIQQSTVRFEAGDQDYVPVYLIKARRQAMGQKDFDFHVCNHAALTVDPAWSGIEHYALIYGGDKYDATTKRVIAEDPTDGWSFLACAGNAAAKMHLYRHTHAGGYDANGWYRFGTTLAQRTTLMKAITAQYCENGLSFTINGTPLAFTANPGFAMPPTDFTMTPAPGEGGVRSHEAVWGHGGVVCLDEPRREQFGGLNRAGVEAACGGTPIPTCASLSPSISWSWSLFGYAITGNPW